MVIRLDENTVLDLLRRSIIQKNNTNTQIYPLPLSSISPQLLWYRYQSYGFLATSQQNTISFLMLDFDTNTTYTATISNSFIASSLADKDVVGYHLIPLGVSEYNYSNSRYISFVFLVKAESIKDNETYVYGVFLNAIIKITNTSVQVELYDILKVDNDSLVGNYQIVVSAGGGSSNITIYTPDGDTQNFITTIRNLAYYYKNTYYTLARNNNNIQISKFLVSYDFAIDVASYRHYFYLSSVSTVLTKTFSDTSTAQYMYYAMKFLFSSFNNSKDKIQVIPLPSITTTRTPNNNVLVKDIAVSSNSNIYYFYIDKTVGVHNWVYNSYNESNTWFRASDIFLRLNFDNAPWVKDGGYITVLQVVRLMEDAEERYIVLDRDVFKVNRFAPIYVKLKEFATGIVIMYHNPDDYVELPLNASVVQRYSQQHITRIYNNTLNTPPMSDHIAYALIFTTNSNTLQIRYNDDYFNIVESELDEYIYTNLSNIVKGSRRHYTIDKVKYIGASVVNSTKFKNAQGVLKYSQSSSNHFINGVKIFDTTTPQPVEYNSNVVIVNNIPQLNSFNYTTPTIRIKNLEVYLESNNTRTHLVFKKDFDLLSGTVSLPSVCELSDYRNLVVKIDNITSYLFDKLVIVVDYVVMGGGSNEYDYISSNSPQSVGTYSIKCEKIGSFKNIYIPDEFKQFYYYMFGNKIYLFNNSHLYRNRRVKCNVYLPTTFLTINRMLDDENLLFAVIKKKNKIYTYLNQFERFKKYDVDMQTVGFVKALTDYPNTLITTPSALSINFDITQNMYFLRTTTTNNISLPPSTSTQSKILKTHFVRTIAKPVDYNNNNYQIIRLSKNDNTNAITIRNSNNTITTEFENFRTYFLKGKISDVVQLSNIGLGGGVKVDDIEVVILEKRVNFLEAVANPVDEPLTGDATTLFVNNIGYTEFYAVHNIENFFNDVNNRFWQVIVRSNNTIKNFNIYHNLIKYSINSNISFNVVTGGQTTNKQIGFVEAVTTLLASNDVQKMKRYIDPLQQKLIVDYSYSNNTTITATGCYVNNLIIPYIILGVVLLFSEKQFTVLETLRNNDFLSYNTYFNLEIDGRIIDRITINDAVEYGYLASSYTNSTIELVRDTYDKRIYYKLMNL